MKPQKLGYTPPPRVLSYLQNIPGTELENIHYVQTSSHITIHIRAASGAVDQNKAAQRQHIPKNPLPKEYAKNFRNQCQPFRYADKLLKHMVPLWEERVSDLTKILETRITPSDRTQIQIINASAVHEKLHSGDKSRPHTKLDIALSTLAATPHLSTTQEYNKLPKNPKP